MQHCKLIEVLEEAAEELQEASPKVASATVNALKILRDLEEHGVTTLALETCERFLPIVFSHTHKSYDETVAESASECQLCAALLARKRKQVS